MRHWCFAACNFWRSSCLHMGRWGQEVEQTQSGSWYKIPDAIQLEKDPGTSGKGAKKVGQFTEDSRVSD